jgi:hypothetical protein
MLKRIYQLNAVDAFLICVLVFCLIVIGLAGAAMPSGPQPKGEMLSTRVQREEFETSVRQEVPDSVVAMKFFGDPHGPQGCALKYSNGDVAVDWEFPAGGVPVYGFYSTTDTFRYSSQTDPGTPFDARMFGSLVADCVAHAKLVDYHHRPRVEADFE